MLDAADEADGFADFPDVREHLTELLARGEPSLEDVDWGRFRHAYGPADDVPGLLRGLYDKDAKRASHSLSTLWNRFRHQGGSSAPAALAVPFLLRAVSDPAVHNRPELLLLAAEAGHRNHFGDDRRDNLLRVENPPDELWIDVSGYPVRWTLQAARRAIAASASQLIGLLDDPDPVLRIHAAYALATAASPPPAVRRALGARLDVEQDASVRVGLVLAVTQLTIEQGGDPDLVTWTERLWTGQDNPADLRLAGALAWLCATSAPPSQPLLDLLQAQAGATATGWLSRVPWPDDIDHRGGLVAWLVSFLGDALDTQVQVIRTAIAHRERTVAVSACRAAYDVARTWRTRTDDMRDLLAGVLDHPDHDVRVVAADLLALTGAVSTPVADRVAAALGDQDPTLRALATSTLAHRGDARAVAPLADLLTLGRCPWPSTWTKWAAPPRRLLDLLGAHADALRPAVLHRLANPGDRSWHDVRRDLIHGLATWPDRSADTVATLCTLITQRGEDRHTIATVLGRIGPAAAAAVPILDELATRADADLIGVLTWARWKITGEQTTRTAETLAHLAATAPDGPEGLRLLADLGPAAAAHVPMLRTRLTATYEWAQAEAAHALWRCTGDPTDVIPALLHVLHGRTYLPLFVPVHKVVIECLGELGPLAEPAIPTLTSYLEADRRRDSGSLRHDPISWDQYGRQLAAAALSRIRPSSLG